MKFPKLNDLHWPYPKAMYEDNGSFMFLKHSAFEAIEAAIKQTNGIMLTAGEGWGVQFQTAADFVTFKLILNWSESA
jgi:hypothetical protein